ncbi:hypothetical protein F4821DRAFT_170534 [Hypoxylon rubiginosum]|uniref:Uncharacterized protein n=1 Tax=Hypoxylon rubiginosum TaxID=110542 RepID=A0ACC0CVA5_9PEZI|nr:hypothetical protein F4821DRAFT_170534 [Hypoxylon rubiginosum]
MPRPVTVPRPGQVCQICDSIIGRRLPSTKYPLSARNVTRTQGQVGWNFWEARAVQKRMLASAAIPTGKAMSSASNIQETAEKHDGTTKRRPTTASQELSSVTNMMTYLERGKSKVLSNRRIPPEADVSAALKACRVVADYIMDDAVQPQISHMVNELDSAASELLSLDNTNSPQSSKSSSTTFSDLTAQVKQIIDKISDTAYSVVSHPPVFITPELLKLYVDIQARLGKPETLPRVFQMYASKPMPREAAGSISYVDQSPTKVANAIDAKVTDTALDTAIEARNLDAAVGIIENSYAAKAFIRSKLMRQGILPAGTFAATPIAAYILATNFSSLQSTMDGATATNVAFAGILAYVGFTASIGIVALTTANDQMRRVTWAPGMPLRTRWMREEERAALDKIACAWGFQEKWRQGEEEGADWDALREYIGQKGMVLDRTELMEGMDH